MSWVKLKPGKHEYCLDSVVKEADKSLTEVGLLPSAWPQVITEVCQPKKCEAKLEYNCKKAEKGELGGVNSSLWPNLNQELEVATYQ